MNGYMPPPYGYAPPPQQNNYMQYIDNKMKELESRLSQTPTYNVPPSPTQPLPPQQTSVVVINSEDEITPHTTTWEFMMTGKKLYFYNPVQNEFLVTWHDASIPKTIKKKFIEIPEVTIDDNTQQNVENPIFSRFDRLENEIFEIKGMIRDATTNTFTSSMEIHNTEDSRSASNSESNNAKPKRKQSRAGNGRFRSNSEE